MSAGKGQDDRAGAGKGQRPSVPAVAGTAVRQVRHGDALRRDEAQDRHPHPRQEMHGQGAAAGRAGYARARTAGDQHGLRPAPAGQKSALHHLDGQGQQVMDNRGGAPRTKPVALNKFAVFQFGDAMRR